MHSRGFRRLALTAVVVAVVLVALGAYVRLSHAGLGCPDWPVCYGKLTWPKADTDIANANLAFPERPVETPKAAKEQIHRIVAGFLGLLVLALGWIAGSTRAARTIVVAASVSAAAGIAVYARQSYGVAGVLSAIAVILPLAGAFLPGLSRNGRIALGLLGLIIFQAMLGMWTVTLLLKPIIVTAHLLGGLATLALLTWLAARQTNRVSVQSARWPLVAALAILSFQIFLGGWTSTNYAALACPDFPTCQGELVPDLDVKEAFILWRGIGVDYEGGVLDARARATIHVVHRLMAVIVTIALIALIGYLVQRPENRAFAIALALLLALQLALGIYNVVGGLPLANAVAHNAVAALLLVWFVLALTWRKERRT